jgi:hypothetical protein
MKTITVDELHAQLRAQDVPRLHVAFKCPMCGTVQSMADLILAGAGKDEEEVEKYIGFSCVGRWTHGGGPPKKKGTQVGCNWTLGGLFQCHEVEVVTPDGKRHPQFETATQEEAQAHMKKGSE